jgi:hypothetical protein
MFKKHSISKLIEIVKIGERFCQEQFTQISVVYMLNIITQSKEN